MTTEETEQLIAEIREKFLAMPELDDHSTYVAYTHLAEKIIKRFAHNLSYIIHLSDGQDLTLSLAGNNEVVLTLFKTDLNVEHEAGLRPEEIKQLRNNINKMLEYLDGE